jgi:hypothetical protein
LSPAGPYVHPTAYQGHFWQQINDRGGPPYGQIGALYFNSTNGVNDAGEAISIGNNCDPGNCDIVWFEQARGTEMIWKDAPSEPNWVCIETHVKLNTADPYAADGTEEFWVDDVLDASHTGLNMRGSYDTYGINQITFGNYWNGGAPEVVEHYRDNIVIATERIGCDVVAQAGPTPTATSTPTATPTSTPTATPTDTPATPTATPTIDPSDPTGVLAWNWRIFR